MPESLQKKGYSANHAFSQIIFCAGCGEQFRRIHWNNRGKKSVVWRCVTRLKEKNKCRARTVSEETLKAAFLEALNEMVDDSDTYLNRLRENLEAAINSANPMSAEALSAKMAELQRELINRTERRENYDDITEEILRLRELQEQKGMDDAAQKEHTKRIKELQKFIQSQPSEITEIDESLVKKLLEKVTVHDDYLEFRFKSGVTISIEMLIEMTNPASLSFSGAGAFLLIFFNHNGHTCFLCVCEKITEQMINIPCPFIFVMLHSFLVGIQIVQILVEIPDCDGIIPEIQGSISLLIVAGEAIPFCFRENWKYRFTENIHEITFPEDNPEIRLFFIE